jgi:MFS transporter, AAHS family, 4-hydroxybenzoate transporter
MTETPQRVDVAQLIETQKANAYRISILLWATLVMGIEGYDMQVVGFAAPAIIKAWRVNRALFGPIFGWGLFGYMLGATVLSNLADRVGRKKLIVGGGLLFGAFTLAAAYSTSVTELLVLRFIAGLGLGCSIPSAIALSAEYAPARGRATAISVIFIGYNIGSAVGGFIAAKTIPAFGWPSVFYIGGLAPIVLSLVLIFALPESVRFLALRPDRQDRVAAIVSKLAPGQKFAPGTQFFLREENQRGLPVTHLFTDGRAMMTSLLWLAYISSLLGHAFLTNWLPTILESSGKSLARADIAGGLLQAGGGAGCLVVGWLLDRYGISSIAMGFALTAPLVVLFGVVGGSDLMLWTLTFLTGICLLGGQVGLNALSGSLYPTYIRSTGAGWAFGVGRIGSILGPVIGGFLINRMPPSSLFIWAALPPLLCAGATFFLGREPMARQARAAPVVS